MRTSRAMESQTRDSLGSSSPVESFAGGTSGARPRALHQATGRPEVHWIADDQYLFVTLLSIRSFLRHHRPEDFRIVVHYQGVSDSSSIREIFDTWVHPTVEVVDERSDSNGPEVCGVGPLVRNRLQRMRTMQAVPAECVGALFDSDVFFAGPLGAVFDHLATHKSFVAGTVEFVDVRAAHLYCRPTGFQHRSAWSFDDAKHIPRLLEERGLRGPVPQINNGVIFFRAAQEVGSLWEELYRAQLCNQEVSAEDDQVPLAIAIATSGSELVQLPQRFNSLGSPDGTCDIFHVWAGRWKEEILSALPPNPVPATACGRILRDVYDPGMQPLWNAWPSLCHDEERPWRYGRLQGYIANYDTYRRCASVPQFVNYCEFGCSSRGRSTVFIGEVLAGRHDSMACKLFLDKRMFTNAELLEWKLARAIVSEIVGEVGILGDPRWPRMDAIFIDTERATAAHQPLRVGDMFAAALECLNSAGQLLGFDLTGRPQEKEFQRWLGQWSTQHSMDLRFERGMFVATKE